MEIQFLGSTKEVGRSAILIETKGKKILLDAGVKLGSGDEFPEIPKKLAKKLDYVAITHAHLDHSGFAPFLVQKGFDGKFFVTKPTRDLMQLLLADYRKIARMKEKKVFAESHMNKAMKNTELVNYGETKNLGEIEMTFYNSGHILGSSSIRLDDGRRSVFYTGDLNYRETTLLPPANTDIPETDVLIIESTYGSKEDRLNSLKSTQKKLANKVKETIKRNGKTLIPVFAVGRGQEIMLTLQNYVESGYVPETNGYTDGMVNKATRIYRQNSKWMKEEIINRILSGHDDPFESDYFQIPSTRNKRNVMEKPSPVILATSGMLTGGPSRGYLEELAGDSKNSIVLVGYQVEGTLGRELVDGVKKLVMTDEDGNQKKLNVKCDVEQIHFSAHADYQQLTKYVQDLPEFKQAFTVHGESDKTVELADVISEKTSANARSASLNEWTVV